MLSRQAEEIGVPNTIFGELFAPNWNWATLKTVVTSLIWLGVHLATKRLLERLHYLEKLLRI